jgi:ABC-type antimicrobial peptide transport system permease subunit
VGQRMHEMGIRIALGANPGKVLRQVLGQGLRLTLVGIAFGVVAAAGVTRLLSVMLYQVNAMDAKTFTLVAVFFTAVGLIACYVPARRAASADPIVTLRYE